MSAGRRDRLLAEAGLTYKRGFVLAETAEKNIHQIKQGQNPGATGGGSINFAGCKTGGKKETLTSVLLLQWQSQGTRLHAGTKCNFPLALVNHCGAGLWCERLGMSTWPILPHAPIMWKWWILLSKQKMSNHQLKVNPILVTVCMSHGGGHWSINVGDQHDNVRETMAQSTGSCGLTCREKKMIGGGGGANTDRVAKGGGCGNFSQLSPSYDS